MNYFRWKRVVIWLLFWTGVLYIFPSDQYWKVVLAVIVSDFITFVVDELGL